MPLSALALVLLAALLHATWNIAAKRAGGDHRFTLITSLLTSVLWLPAGLWFGWHEVPRALWRHTTDPAQRARTRAGVRWGLLTGALIAGYSVIDGYAIRVLAIGPVLFDYACNVLRVPRQLPTMLQNRPALRRAWRTQWKHALVVSTLGPLACILVLYALQVAPLSHVAPAREISMLVAALLGGRLLGESDRGLRLLGALCTAGGVMALAWG